MPIFKIVILNKLKEHHLTAIRNAAPDSLVITTDLASADQHIADTDILVAWGHDNIRPLFLQAANLKWLHALSAGIEHWLFPEMLASNAILTNSKGIHGIPISEHVLALMLAFTRGLNVSIRRQQNKRWQRTFVDEIHEKTLGIIGLGNIGRELAKKAKGLGLQVLASKREQTSELFVDTLYAPDQLAEMLPQCDFVVLALPSLPETQGLFNEQLFALMKPSAHFINISRGSIVVEEDLIAALQQQKIRGAGLDVFQEEPLPDTSPLWDMENVIITPHVAGLSPAYLDRAIKLFADNLSRFIQYQEMLNMIDKRRGY